MYIERPIPNYIQRAEKRVRPEPKLNWVEVPPDKPYKEASKTRVKVGKEVLEPIAARAGAVLEYRALYVKEIGDTKWVRYPTMYNRLYGRVRKSSKKAPK